jgi:flagellar basal body-associated protein FliL
MRQNMADEKEEKPEGSKPQEAKEKTDAKTDEKGDQSGEKKALIPRLLPWVIMAVIVAVCAGGGFGLGRMFGGQATSEQAEPGNGQSDKYLQTDTDGSDASQGAWYYDLRPVVANPDVPGATRYVRASLSLQMGGVLSETDGTALIDEKKPILIDWLITYLKSLTLNDMTGDKNMRRIKSQILEAFNEHIFPDTKPKITKILLKEFAIQ